MARQAKTHGRKGHSPQKGFFLKREKGQQTMTISKFKNLIWKSGGLYALLSLLVILLVFVVVTAGLVLLFGSIGFSIGTGIAIFCSALGLVIHILRFQNQGQLVRGSRLPLCLVAGSFCLMGVDAWVRHQTTWWVVEPWVIVPAVAPWAAGSRGA